ncbi:sigma-70, region 4 [Leptospira broomii serovar Hurstbridge str. 5399]|uniref:Sigma-70, region 4 n=1 Tax=Leptospira broomii serovar Hurstbridge str. 5399 TaxID=1049789 RepID=T0FAP3_9LEPT|nr:sigma-70, region 4 [Leptospira broomii serovar Hurstbridge str. 5399]
MAISFFKKKPNLLEKTEPGKNFHSTVSDTLFFEKLYNKNKDHLFSFIRRSVRDESTALDLLQDTFLNFFKHYSGKVLPEEQIARMILFRIARNLMINHSKSYYQKNVSLVGEEVGTVFGSKTQGPEGQVLDDMAAQDLASMFSILFEILPEDQKTALDLRYSQGCKLEEIAQVLELSVSGVSRLLERAEKAILQEGKRRGFQPESFLKN